MAKTFRTRDESDTWHERHGPLAPKVGDLAPDFELQDATGSNPVRLSDFNEKKPVALIFGSFT